MTLISYLLSWHAVNAVMPFLGMIASGYILYSNKTCTANKAVSTALSLSLILWLMLVWADWGSAVFTPSYQSMWARILLLIVSALIMFELRRNTIDKQKLSRTNASLIKENQRLNTINQLLQQKINQQQGSNNE